MPKKYKEKRDRLEMDCVVLQAHKAGMFTVKCKSMADMIILATLSGRMRQNFIKVVAGDAVVVEVSTYDPTKGRIISRGTTN
jgi:translation initiation factor IF-1